MEPKTINSMNEYIEYIKKDTENWDFYNEYGSPWFRGQGDESKPLLPSVFRQDKGKYHEFNLTRTFRERSSTLGTTPLRSDELDKWLFLMQHNGLPTRLLDWTESSLIALFFAVNSEEKNCNRAVWMIHPLELNYYAIKAKILPNTWTLNNQGYVNIHAAFNISHPHEMVNEKSGVRYIESELPVALPTYYCHPRMSAQKSCFTIHGTDKRDFEAIFRFHEITNNGYFKKYIILSNKSDKIKDELISIGITYSTIYPDFEGLSKELRERYISR